MSSVNAAICAANTTVLRISSPGWVMRQIWGRSDLRLQILRIQFWVSQATEQTRRRGWACKGSHGGAYRERRRCTGAQWTITMHLAGWGHTRCGPPAENAEDLQGGLSVRTRLSRQVCPLERGVPRPELGHSRTLRLPARTAAVIGRWVWPTAHGTRALSVENSTFPVVSVSGA